MARTSPTDILIATPIGLPNSTALELTSSEDKQQNTLGRFFLPLTIAAKLESLIYSLGTGLLAAAIMVFAFSHLSPIFLVVISSLYLSGFTAWLILTKIAKNATRLQQALLLLSSLMVGVLFALCISFAALPSIGLSATLAGGGFLIAATNIGLYLLIALAISQLSFSAMSSWFTTHQSSTKSSIDSVHSVAKTLNLTRKTESNPSYNFTEKIYLLYGFIISSTIGLAIGALSFYGISHFLPLAFLSLGIHVGAPVLMPLAITLLVTSSLMITKLVITQFFNKAEQNRSERLKSSNTAIPSLLNELLDESEGTFFFLEPLKKTRQVFNALWNANYSFRAYTAHQKKYYPTHLALTSEEFRARNIVSSFLFLIVGLPIMLVKPLLTQEYQNEIHKKLENHLFWRNPLSYSWHFIDANYSYLFSYTNFKLRYPESPMSAQQFYLRNTRRFVAIPLALGLLVLSLYINTLGATQFMLLFGLDAATALGASSLVSSALAGFLCPLFLILWNNSSPATPMIIKPTTQRPADPIPNASMVTSDAAIPYKPKAELHNKPTDTPAPAPGKGHTSNFTPLAPMAKL